MTKVKAIKLKVNESFTIETESLASAGYQTDVSFNNGAFEIINQSKLMDVNENPADVVATDDIVIGGSVGQFYELKALQEGHFIVEVVKERRFGNKVPKIFETYVVDVIV